MITQTVGAFVPPELIELAIDVLLPMVESCLTQHNSPDKVAHNIAAKDPVTLYYLRKSIRANCDWNGQGKQLYDHLVKANPTEAQIKSLISDFQDNRMEYLDLV